MERAQLIDESDKALANDTVMSLKHQLTVGEQHLRKYQDMIQKVYHEMAQQKDMDQTEIDGLKLQLEREREEKGRLAQQLQKHAKIEDGQAETAHQDVNPESKPIFTKEDLEMALSEKEQRINELEALLAQEKEQAVVINQPDPTISLAAGRDTEVLEQELKQNQSDLSKKTEELKKVQAELERAKSGWMELKHTLQESHKNETSLRNALNEIHDRIMNDLSNLHTRSHS